jgi:hypothetical protein
MISISYVPNPTWTSSTPINADLLNHLQTQYQFIIDFLASHNHNDQYFLQNEMDSYFWNAANSGPGSTLNADKLEGSEGADISSGIDNGVIGFWYGTLADFTGKLLTGYPNWHLCDGTDGTEDLRDLFPIGASAPGSGYQVGDNVGNNGFKPAGSVIISGHILTIDEINHYHYLTEFGAIWGQAGAGSGTIKPYNNIISSQASITSSVGGGGSHNHAGTFAGATSNLFPPFLSLICVQYIGV